MGERNGKWTQQNIKVGNSCHDRMITSKLGSGIFGINRTNE